MKIWFPLKSHLILQCTSQPCKSSTAIQSAFAGCTVQHILHDLQVSRQHLAHVHDRVQACVHVWEGGGRNGCANVCVCAPSYDSAHMRGNPWYHQKFCCRREVPHIILLCRIMFLRGAQVVRGIRKIIIPKLNSSSSVPASCWILGQLASLICIAIVTN